MKILTTVIWGLAHKYEFENLSIMTTSLGFQGSVFLCLSLRVSWCPYGIHKVRLAKRLRILMGLTSVECYWSRCWVLTNAKSETKGKVIITGLLDEVMDGTCSDDIWSLQRMIQLTHNFWVFIPAHMTPSDPVMLYVIDMLSVQFGYYLGTWKKYIILGSISNLLIKSLYFNQILRGSIC